MLFKSKFPARLSELEKTLNIAKLENTLKSSIKDDIKVQKTLKGNDNLSEKSVIKSLEDGLKLWNNLLAKAEGCYKNKKAILIRAVGTQRNLREVEIYNSVKKIKARPYFLDIDGVYQLVRECFVWFANQDELSTNNKAKSVIFATGEGAFLMDAADYLIQELTGFKDNQEGIEFLSGPVMVCKNDNRLNDFVSKVVTDRRIDTSIKLHRNGLLSLQKLFAGYFHFWVVGDNILTELPHEFMNSSKDVTYRMIVNDEDLANEFRNFFANYSRNFAKSFDEPTYDLKLISDFYQYTFDARKEKIDKEGLLANLRISAENHKDKRVKNGYDEQINQMVENNL